MKILASLTVIWRLRPPRGHAHADGGHAVSLYGSSALAFHRKHVVALLPELKRFRF